METVYAQDQKAFTEAIEAIRPGDCVRIDSISAVSDSAKAFLEAAVKLADKGGELVCSKEAIDAALTKIIPARKAKLLEPNQKALAMGMDL